MMLEQFFTRKVGLTCGRSSAASSDVNHGVGRGQRTHHGVERGRDSGSVSTACSRPANARIRSMQRQSRSIEHVKRPEPPQGGSGRVVSRRPSVRSTLRTPRSSTHRPRRTTRSLGRRHTAHSQQAMSCLPLSRAKGPRRAPLHRQLCEVGWCATAMARRPPRSEC